MTTRMMQMLIQLRKRVAHPLKMQPGGELLQAFGAAQCTVHLVRESAFDVRDDAGRENAGEGESRSRQESAL